MSIATVLLIRQALEQYALDTLRNVVVVGPAELK